MLVVSILVAVALVFTAAWAVGEAWHGRWGIATVAVLAPAALVAVVWSNVVYYDWMRS